MTATPQTPETTLSAATPQRNKAVDHHHALSLAKLVERTRFTRLDVYGLVSGHTGKAGSAPGCLLATGHAKVCRSEEEGLCVYLTKQGLTTDFSEYPFAKKDRTAPAAKPVRVAKKTEKVAQAS